jgi:hypothetical protein
LIPIPNFIESFTMTGKTDEIHDSNTSSEGGAMPALTQVPTSVTLSAEQFEKLYLTPMMHRQPALAKNLGNPTPLYAYAFVRP